MSTDDNIPLFVVGLPKDEPNVELVTKKFSDVLKKDSKGNFKDSRG